MKTSRWFAFLLVGMLSLGVLPVPAPTMLGPIAQPRAAHAQLGYNFLDLFYIKRVAWLCNEHYVERQQIHPDKMFRKALERIQLLVPAILVRFHPKQVDVQVNQTSKSFELTQKKTIFDAAEQLKKVFAFIQKNYDGEVKLRKIEFAAIHGILETLDSHTNFLPPSYYNDMRIHTGGKFGGLGIVIQNREGFLTVVSPMPDTPAAKVGIKPLDRIVRIGDESTINMSLTDAVTKLRGRPGTKVVIWIMRKGFTKPRKFEIIRAEIKVKSVSSNLLKDKVGYIRIKNFQQNSTGDMQRALQRMNAESGGLKGLILDLRDNPGGLLDQAIKISNTFLQRGVIVTHAGGSSRQKVHRANLTDTEKNYPIIVLVNQGSASASEIVAGALKNNNRALVLGKRSYGKGTVQILYPIHQFGRGFTRELTALKLTVAQYLTPGGISIQKIGIAPDIDLQPVHIEKSQIQFFSNKDEKKKKKKGLPKYLKGVQEQRKPLYKLDYFNTLTDAERRKRYENEYIQKKKMHMDFEIELAHKLLVATKTAERGSFYKSSLAALEKVRKDERQKILNAIKKLGVDWSKTPPKTAEPQIEMSYKLLPPAKKAPSKNKKGKDVKKKGKDAKKGDKSTKAGKKISKPSKNIPPKGLQVWSGSAFRLQVTLKNKGKEAAYRVRALTRSKYWFLNRKEFIFGKIAPGKQRTWTVDVQLPKWVKTQVHQLQLGVNANGKALKKDKDIILYCNGYVRPRFAFSYALEERQGNGDQLLQAGESISVRVTVRNLGPGKARKVLGLLKNKTGRELFIERGRIRFGALKPGETAVGRFRFRLKKETMRKVISMHVSIFDAELLTTVQERLSLRVYPGELNALKLQPKFVKVEERFAWVYGGASFDAPRIARIPKGSFLKVQSKLGPFVQVHIARPTKLQSLSKKEKPPTVWLGWIASKDLKRNGGKILFSDKGKAPKRIKYYWQFKTPQIAVKGLSKPLWVQKNTFRLKGSIRNNVTLRDAYILVNKDKVYYRALRNLPKLDFDKVIKLKEGRNRILIAARETEKFTGYREFFIFYRKGGKKKYKTSGYQAK